MFNNLIARAIVPVTIAVTGFVVFGCILLYTFIKSDMTDEAILHVDNLAETVSKSARYAMMQDDRESLRNIVSNVGTLTDVGQIRIYDQGGRIRFSGNPEETAAGSTSAEIDPWVSRMMEPGYAERTKTHHDIGGGSGLISVSIPILNEPKCSTAACHFHAANEPVLGFLTLGISSKPLEKTLDLLRSRMIIFSVMVLFLTVGGVAALLRMNLFLPILRLTYCAGQAVQGVRAKDLPKADNKLGSLERDFRQLVQQRDDALQGWQTTGSAQADTGNGSTIDSRLGNKDAGHQPAEAAGPGQNP
ncbi:hypothetical protein SAMN02745165_01835 [Malonomonas rubra DSM 5091]|uniref:HAMP domain-containing protein n=1 Tax=Malonomonas rubra DSM 5091 TaxID=1122189 RepID=A0A1M6HHJ0_MALRU|nr:hypothetical protein [Malonomonas rubra]SHJ21635.1 hypothetical protein SAMN02745165_01835 [Malonomonas rubra DSM 5091]